MSAEFIKMLEAYLLAKAEEEADLTEVHEGLLEAGLL